jgi:predicted nuclease of predicted toxin-antitoxin system
MQLLFVRSDLENASDEQIFAAARAVHACVLTKDADFLRLLETFGPPPQILWLTCGNTSNARLRQVLSATFTMQWLSFSMATQFLSCLTEEKAGSRRSEVRG